MSARYVTGAEAWLLTALAFIILWVFWRLLNLAADLIGYGLRRADLNCQFRRSLVLAETNIAYARLREDEAGWAAVEAERAEWDATLGDGLEHDVRGEDAPSVREGAGR